MTTETFVLSLSDIHDARERIAGQAIVTPLMRSAFLDERTGGRIFLKCENLQRTGSFKFRGAYNALSAMGPEQRARGIVAVSSGNHAQGVAEAARLFGVSATIFMPAEAPAIKVERVERSGAKVVPFDRNKDDRDALALTLCEETGAVFVRPYDDYNVMAGQGTAGMESAEQLKNEGLDADVGLICCGGGGLSAGVSTAWRSAFPSMDIRVVEPEGFDDTVRSLASGERVGNIPGSSSICDAILTEMPGVLTFPINLANGVSGVSVNDEEVLAAVAFAFKELKMIVEPGGAVCLAALLAGKVDVKDKTVLAVLSGGNADPSMIVRALDQAA